MKFSFKDLQRSYTLLYEPEEYVRLARAYWILLLAATTCITLAGIAFGAWQFFAPPDVSLSSEPAQQGIVGFNREQLEKIVHVFEARRAHFETMMTGE